MIQRPLAVVAASLLALTLASPAMAAPAPSEKIKTNERNGSFDLQAHRGGLAEWTEESLPAFANALEVGVTTLELDTMLSEDGKIMVWHDDRIQADKCADTDPAFKGDPEFPYVGQRVADLSFAQLSTLNCGYQQLPGYPDQQVADNNKIAQLKDVFSLVKKSRAKKVKFNIETKVEDGKAGSESMRKLTKAVLNEIDGWDMEHRSTLQSFDWGALNLARDLAASGDAPQLPLIALSSGDKAMGVGQPGKVPELGGIDIDDYDGSLAKAAKAQGYDVISPTYKAVTEQMISEAHELGLPVVPWTVNKLEDMERLMDMGVDGLITNFPTRLRELMKERGLKLPKAYTAVR